MKKRAIKSDIATKLKDDSYAAKYARAKYSFSKEGEYISQHQIYYHNNHGKFTSKYREIFIVFRMKN